MSGSCHLLVIDDDEDCATELAELLTLHGCTASVAYSVSDALGAAAQKWPDCVIVDAALGTESGIALALQFSKAEAPPRIVIASGIPPGCLQLGDFGPDRPLVLTKPVSIEEVLAVAEATQA